MSTATPTKKSKRKGRGRPPVAAKIRKRNIVRARCTDAEKKAVAKAAVRYKSTESDVLRELIRVYLVNAESKIPL